jgi:hypothetical protein
MFALPGLLAVVTVASAAGRPLACPPDHVVKVSLRGWQADIEHAERESYDSLLQSLRLRPVLNQNDEEVQTVERLDRIDVFSARLSGGPSPDVVVQAKFTGHWGGRARFYRIQVLRPVGAGAFCALGDDLSLDETVLDNEVERSPMTFSFVRTIDADRDSIEVSRKKYWLAQGRGSETVHAFWRVSEQGLSRSYELRESELHAPQGPYPYQRAWFELVGKAPKTPMQYFRACKTGWPDRDSLAPRPDCEEVRAYAANALTISARRHPTAAGYFTLFGSCPLAGGVVDLCTFGGAAGTGCAHAACDSERQWRYNEAYFTPSVGATTYFACQLGSRAVFVLDAESTLVERPDSRPCAQPYTTLEQVANPDPEAAACHPTTKCADGRPYICAPVLQCGARERLRLEPSPARGRRRRSVRSLSGSGPSRARALDSRWGVGRGAIR